MKFNELQAIKSTYSNLNLNDDDITDIEEKMFNYHNKAQNELRKQRQLKVLKAESKKITAL